MLSNEFNRPLRLHRKPSYLIAAYLLLVHFLAVLSVLLTDLEFILTLSLTIFLISSAGYHTFRYWPESFDNNTSWVWQKDADWIETNSLHDKYWQLQTNPVVTPWFVIVPLRDQDSKHKKIIIAYDQLDTDTFRRLRVRLKYYQGDVIRMGDEST